MGLTDYPAVIHFTHHPDHCLQVGLVAFKCYVDNAFSIAQVGHMSWYVLYGKDMPTGQVKVLKLWDEIHIHLPRTESKQISGAVLPILRFEVDPNRMTAYLRFGVYQ